MYDDDDYDDGYVQFHQPASPADIIPSIPDVPGRQAMEEETGEGAMQVLERAYDLDREDPYVDVDNLPGWRTQDVLSTITYRFGFEEPVAPISSSREMEPKMCAWACSDESWAVPNASILPTFLQHLLEGDLKGFQADLCDLTSPDSDLDLEWNFDVEIICQRDKTLYSVRPCGSEHSSHSILLESAATVLQIPRTGWGHDFVLLIRNLVELGAEFHPSWKGPAHCAPLTPPSINTLGCRPASYKPTLVDFGVYVQRRDTFIRPPHGRAALFYGGIVGRLVRLAIPDFQDIACLDPSEDILKAGTCVLNGNGEEALWHEAQTPAEINLICGVYSVETGTFIQPLTGIC
ncbi:hypothetical protein DFH08DRAFT_1055374 [Mycena albidolilacea]|uniref:Uncharacterized protein n=1 Tax=Mycena albidolilacea TaxID=1033008 RepID=A0AAD7E9I1_9AGAR|nr:hypothetical protein DFH08DRAFT_1055374 [Mycena albidolilacea]